MASTDVTCHRPVAARVLVVDDDAALAEMLGIVLRNEGFDSARLPGGRPGARGLP